MAKEKNACFNCGYHWADVNEKGEPISYEYCHYNDPWPAPCEYENQEEPEDDWDWGYGLDDEEEYCPSASHGDYSPNNPWDAPGMSVKDFI